MSCRFAALALTVVLVSCNSQPTAIRQIDNGGTWRFDLSSTAHATVLVDLDDVVPAARPVVGRLAGTVTFDNDLRSCRPPAESCASATPGAEGRVGIHLDEDTTAHTFPSNRFLVYHELGHAVWDMIMPADGHRAFVRAVRRFA